MAGLHHGPWSRTIEDGLCPWSDLMVPTSMIRIKRSVYKVFGPLTRCEPNVDQEEWPWTKKLMCLFIWIYAQKGKFWKERKYQVWPFSCLLLSSSSFPQKKFSLKIYYNYISLPWALRFQLKRYVACIYSIIFVDLEAIANSCPSYDILFISPNVNLKICSHFICLLKL